MTKAYCVFYSEKEHIVWGMGGRSGNRRRIRRGYNLPGGTIDRVKGKATQATTADIQNTILSELREEFGSRHAATILEAIDTSHTALMTNQLLDGYRVYLCFIPLNKLIFPPGIRIPINRQDVPEPIKPYDEPFDLVIMQSATRVAADQATPSWFRVAIRQLKGIDKTEKTPFPFDT